MNNSAVGPASKSKASAVAPTQTSLKATQPQSIILRSFIEDAKSPVSDFSTIAVIAPSMSLGISVNGPGLGETKTTMRGFPDGQYNITWDGIPFGDTNGPTHHSTAYFPASVIGRVEVERGPGNASNLGQATFGGSVNLFSRDLLKEQTVGTLFSFGTWNTKLVGLSYDSGFSKGGDALLGINVQHMSSDGYRTYSAVNGDNIMLKYLKPLGHRQQSIRVEGDARHQAHAHRPYHRRLGQPDWPHHAKYRKNVHQNPAVPHRQL